MLKTYPKPKDHKLFWAEIFLLVVGKSWEIFWATPDNWKPFQVCPVFTRLFRGLMFTWGYKYLYILARHNVNGIDWVLQETYFYGNSLVGPNPRWIYSGSGQYAWVAVWQHCRIENFAVESTFESRGENKTFTSLVMAFGYGYSLT